MSSLFKWVSSPASRGENRLAGERLPGSRKTENRKPGDPGLLPPINPVWYGIFQTFSTFAKFLILSRGAGFCGQGAGLKKLVKYFFG